MADDDLDQVKKLTEQLSPKDREQLFEHLVGLPDSPIKPIPFPPSKPPHPTRFEHYPITFTVSVKLEDGQVIYYMDELEVFRALFNAENYANVFFEKVKSEALPKN